MSGARRIRSATKPWTGIFGVTLALLVTVTIAYHFQRTLALDVGSALDIGLVRDFYADELDLTYRYRWSRASSSIAVPGRGTAPVENIVVRAQPARPAGAEQDVTLKLEADGTAWTLDSASEIGNGLVDYRFRPPDLQRAAPDEVTLRSSTFRPEGDARDLGVKVDIVTLQQSTTGLNLPPLGLLFWSVAFALGILGILSAGGSIAGAVGGLLGAIALGGLVATSPLLVAAYLPPMAALVGAAGLLVSQRRRIGRLPEAVDSVGQSERLPRVIMLCAMTIYAVVSVWVVAQSDWIGHADYAENAVVARNYVEGRGVVVDYVAQFYRERPEITHPADTWPLLQPLMIAPFMAILGTDTWVAKLPNIFVMLALTWLVYHIASRIWDRRVGLIGGLLTLSHPYFFNSTLYPINDLPFTALFLALAWLVWRNVSPLALDTDTETRPMSNTQAATSRLPDRLAQTLQRPTFKAITVGIVAALLFWCKPSGAILVLGLAAWAAWTWWRERRPTGSALPWRLLLVAGAAAAVAIAPLILRNLMSFGVPFYTTEGYDAWILRYWPLRDWEYIYALYPPDALPHPRWVVGGQFGYQNLWDAFVLNVRWVWERGVLGSPGDGDYVLGIFPLLLTGVGIAALTKRAAGLFAMAGVAIGLYAAFILIYWHFEGRYFQVAVPWLLMLAAWGIVWLWDRLRESARNDIGRRWAVLLPLLALLVLFGSSLPVLVEQVRRDTSPTGFAGTMRWLAANSTPDDVVMTRDPWELNWYTRRKAVMIPFGDLETIRTTAARYGVTMLQLGGPVDRVDVSQCPPEDSAVSRYPTGSRPALGSLYCGREIPGFRLVYRDRGGSIYRFEP